MPAQRKPVAPTYGSWTVLDASTRPSVLCRCICGRERKVLLYELKLGKSSSCGCLRNAEAAERSRKLWTGAANPRWAGGVEAIKKRKREEMKAEKARLAAEAAARAARIDAAIAKDEAAAARWAVTNKLAIPPLLPYLLDTRRFTSYNTVMEVNEWGQEEYD